MDNNFAQMPKGGGRLRAMLASLKEDQEKLDSHPIYKEGYDDGLAAAEEKYRKMFTAIANFYDIKDRG